MKVKLKKLKISKDQLTNLPIFYNYISYIEMKKGDPHFHYNEKMSGHVHYTPPGKPLCKIIDYSLINTEND